MTTAIWKRTHTVEQLNQLHRGTIGERIGIEFLEVGPDFLRARMPVDARTKQPAGILHGGASVTLAETLGSVAAYMSSDDGLNAMGLDINANHIRAMRDGWVIGQCRPVHVGRTTQVWQIDITDEQDRLVCASRITMAIVPSSR